MIKIGINGLGRIGRVLLRQILNSKIFKVVAINDINPDLNNIAYLIKYDSTYGKLKSSISINKDQLTINKKKIKFSNKTRIDEVNWKKFNVDYIIDSSGVKKNLVLSKKLIKKVKNIIVTNSPGPQYVDKTLIYGVNDNNFDRSKDFLISSSICDATALAPILKVVNNLFEIKKGFVTTLHPWLGYQNLLDGPSKSYAVPGQIIDNYALGRASPNSLIPKNTSAIKATYEVLPVLRNKFIANSFRIPTSIVSSADVVLELKKKPTQKKLINKIINLKPKIISLSREPLVSSDFTRTEFSSFLDLRFLNILDNHIKFTLWYDNEWGYSSKVLDLIKKINSGI
tara:strand:+ start:18129 stop:19151 length:1023 start_codon:yes stop_codon:yes gene_type:complete